MNKVTSFLLMAVIMLGLAIAVMDYKVGKLTERLDAINPDRCVLQSPCSDTEGTLELASKDGWSVVFQTDSVNRVLNIIRKDGNTYEVLGNISMFKTTGGK